MTARLSACLLAAVLGGACASSGTPTLAGRFVRQGTPSVDVGGPRPAPMRFDRNALLRARTTGASSVTGRSLEATDPRLRQALAQLMVAPTAPHYLEVADAYLQRGVFDRAHDFLERSLKVNGPDAATYDALARLWRDWGQPSEGLGHAYRAVHLAPGSPAALNTLGTMLYRLGNVDAARDTFQQAMRADGSAWYALANLCHVNMKAGQTALAIAQCQKAAALKK
jgi:Tfp pilus assembly protein PilF